MHGSVVIRHVAIWKWLSCIAMTPYKDVMQGNAASVKSHARLCDCASFLCLPMYSLHQMCITASFFCVDEAKPQSTAAHVANLEWEYK